MKESKNELSNSFIYMFSEMSDVRDADCVCLGKLQSEPSYRTMIDLIQLYLPGSVRSLAVSLSATCASRPCFPGVQCINHRPPHVGYVCGRCPPGLYGNGRICMKNSKEGEGAFTFNILMRLGISFHDF